MSSRLPFHQETWCAGDCFCRHHRQAPAQGCALPGTSELLDRHQCNLRSMVENRVAQHSERQNVARGSPNLLHRRDGRGHLSRMLCAAPMGARPAALFGGESMTMVPRLWLACWNPRSFMRAPRQHGLMSWPHISRILTASLTNILFACLLQHLPPCLAALLPANPPARQPAGSLPACLPASAFHPARAPDQHHSQR